MADRYIRKLAAYIGFDIDQAPLQRLDKVLDSVKDSIHGTNVLKFDRDLAGAGKQARQLGDAVKLTDHSVESLGATSIKTSGKLRAVGSSVKSVSNEIGNASRRFDNFSKRADSAISSVNRGVLSMGRSIGSSAVIGGAVLGGGAAYGVGKAATTSLGGAAELEMQSFQLEALVQDADKAKKLFDDMNKKGMISTFSESDFLEGAKTFLPITKDLKQIDKLTGLQERLGASNMKEGMGGAAFSIREALSGDMVSLNERFNLPRDMTNMLKEAPTIEAKITALDKVLNKMGFTQEYLTKVNGAAAAQWDNLKSNATMALKRSGYGALEKLKPVLKDINEYFSSGQADKYFKAWGDGLAWAAQEAIDFGKEAKAGIGSAIDYVKQNYLSNPEFQKLNFKGKVDFVLQNFKTGFDTWYAGGGNQQIKDATSGLVGFVSDALSASTDKLAAIGVELGKSVGSGMYTGFKQFAKDNPEMTALLTFIATPGPLPVKVAAALGTGVSAEVLHGVDVVEKNRSVMDAASGSNQSKLEDTSQPFLSGPTSLVPDDRSLIDKSKDEVLNFLYSKGWLRPDGSNRGGLSNVPFDGYISELHKGERVLTAEENRNYSSSMFQRYTPDYSPTSTPNGADSTSGQSQLSLPPINVILQGGSGTKQDAYDGTMAALDAWARSYMRKNPQVVIG